MATLHSVKYDSRTNYKCGYFHSQKLDRNLHRKNSDTIRIAAAVDPPERTNRNGRLQCAEGSGEHGAFSVQPATCGPSKEQPQHLVLLVEEQAL